MPPTRRCTSRAPTSCSSRSTSTAARDPSHRCRPRPTRTYAGSARRRSGARTGSPGRPRSTAVVRSERGVSDWRRARTTRLWLDEPVEDDADALLAIHSDPASWRHFPSGVVTDPAAGATMVGASRRRFERDGLAYWSVRDVDGGPVVGRGGCMVPDEALGGRGWWHIY